MTCHASRHRLPGSTLGRSLTGFAPPPTPSRTARRARSVRPRRPARRCPRRPARRACGCSWCAVAAWRSPSFGISSRRSARCGPCACSMTRAWRTSSSRAPPRQRARSRRWATSRRRRRARGRRRHDEAFLGGCERLVRVMLADDANAQARTRTPRTRLPPPVPPPGGAATHAHEDPEDEPRARDSSSCAPRGSPGSMCSATGFATRPCAGLTTRRWCACCGDDARDRDPAAVASPSHSASTSNDTLVSADRNTIAAHPSDLESVRVVPRDKDGVRGARRVQRRRVHGSGHRDGNARRRARQVHARRAARASRDDSGAGVNANGDERLGERATSGAPSGTRSDPRSAPAREKKSRVHVHERRNRSDTRRNGRGNGRGNGRRNGDPRAASTRVLDPPASTEARTTTPTTPTTPTPPTTLPGARRAEGSAARRVRFRTGVLRRPPPQPPPQPQTQTQTQSQTQPRAE